VPHIQAAMQESAESQSDLVHLAISRLVLEQSYKYYSPIFKAGLFAHHLRAEAFDEVMRRVHKVPVIAPTQEQDRYHLEQITLFVLTHEVTHYFLHEDQGFAAAWQEFAGGLLEHLHSLWDETESRATFPSTP
jgi:hypothetical protein